MKAIISPTLCLLLLALFSTSAKANVFGRDDRFLANTEAYPYRALVRLSIPKMNGRGSWCTGTWVGPRLVLTAAHCLIGYEPGARIIARRADGWAEAYASGPFIFAQGEGYIRGLRHDREDWALIRLDWSLGDSGWLPIYAEFSVGPEFTQPILLPGYSADIEEGQSLSTHEGCLLMQVRRDGTLGHDCDMTGGASGAPLLHCRSPSDCSVVGMNSSSYRTESGQAYVPRYSHVRSNNGVQARMFVDAVRQALASSADQ
jgi:protease YdgD